MATTSGPVNLAYAIVALVVVVIVVATVALPILSSSAVSVRSETYYNDGVGVGQQLTIYDSMDTTVVFDALDAATVADTIITINGVRYTADDGSTSAHPVVYSDNLFATMQNSTYSNYVLRFSYYDGAAYQNLSNVPFDSKITFFFDKSESELTVSFTDDNGDPIEGINPIVVDATYLAAPSISKDYVYITGSWTGVKVNQKLIDDRSFGLLSSWSGSVTISEQSVDVVVFYNEKEAKVWEVTGTYNLTVELDYSDLSLIAGSEDVYTGGTPHLIIKNSGTEVGDIVPNRCYVIHEVEGHVSSNSESTLIQIIPILLVLTPILMAVGLLRGRS